MFISLSYIDRLKNLFLKIILMNDINSVILEEGNLARSLNYFTEKNYV